MADDPDWAPKQDMSLLCRVCANQHDYLIPIFEGEGLDHDMPTKMEKHLPIKVRENDKLPTQMCYQCASTIIAWSDLHTNCLEADKKLTCMLRINEKKSADAAGLSLADDDDDRNSDHYEDAYDTGADGGGADEDDEDFEKEIKQLISDAGVELGSSSSGTTKQVKLTKPPASKPAAARASRKRKSETTTVVKRESKKSKSEAAAGSSSSGTVALLKPKEENVSADDRCMVWTCCKCISKFSSRLQLNLHLLSHAGIDNDIEHQDSEDQLCPICNDSITDLHFQMVETCNVLNCKFCEQVFTESEVLVVHVKIEHLHKDKTWYRCDICCEIFLKIYMHMNKKHNLRDFEKETLVVKCIEDITFPCEVCGVLCVLSKFCKKHITAESANKQILDDSQASELHAWVDCTNHADIPNCHSCQKCDESFDNCTTLWSHMLLTHQDSEFVCNLCQLISFNGLMSKPMVTRHMQIIHNMKILLPDVSKNIATQTQVISNGTVTFKCPVPMCNKMKLTIGLLLCHLLSHSNEKIYSCEKCDKTFASSSVLYTHVEYVHGNVKAQVCPTCGRSYKGLRSLEIHMKIHSDEKPYVCKVCGARFKQSEGLSSHKFMHANKKFICSFCGDVFRHPVNLRAHIKFHHTERKYYSCTFCEKKLTRPNALKDHIAVVHRTERPFICSVCNDTFATNTLLGVHRRKFKHIPS